ncbi:MAG TPA: ATP-grasp domain-containing protein, partial [Limnochordales bacterium]
MAVPEGRVASTPQEAEAAALELGGPVVLKALVPVGRRGKAGAVVRADGPRQARDGALRLLGSTVGGYPVERLWVERAVPAARELYFSVLVDKER